MAHGRAEAFVRRCRSVSPASLGARCAHVRGREGGMQISKRQTRRNALLARFIGKLERFRSRLAYAEFPNESTLRTYACVLIATIVVIIVSAHETDANAF